MPFSHSAPTYSHADQERDYADLSSNEKEGILDDVFGRNANDIAVRNEREITQQELDDFDRALEDLPPGGNSEAVAATVMCPELIQTETNPTMFLRCENYDAKKAATRFAAYWHFRVELLGNERAFLPITMSEDGAFHEDEELERMMREAPTYRAVLPNDSNGRSVLYAESDQENNNNSFSRAAKLKYHFYALHKIMKQKSSVLRGMVVIKCINDNTGQYSGYKFDRIRMKKCAHFYHNCIPVKLRVFHVLTTESTIVTSVLFPMWLFFANREMRQRVVHHFHNKGGKTYSVLESLESYGFEREGLPVCQGGDYEFPSWDQEHNNSNNE